MNARFVYLMRISLNPIMVFSIMLACGISSGCYNSSYIISVRETKEVALKAEDGTDILPSGASTARVTIWRKSLDVTRPLQFSRTESSISIECTWCEDGNTKLIDDVHRLPEREAEDLKVVIDKLQTSELSKGAFIFPVSYSIRRSSGLAGMTASGSPILRIEHEELLVNLHTTFNNILKIERIDKPARGLSALFFIPAFGILLPTVGVGLFEENGFNGSKVPTLLGIGGALALAGIIIVALPSKESIVYKKE